MSTNARDEQVKAVLLDAAKLVEQGSRRDIWAALTGACGRSYDDATERACDAMRAYLGVDWLTIWSDAPDRTQAEVVEALRGAAEGVGKESGG